MNEEDQEPTPQFSRLLSETYLMKSLININFCGVVVIDNSTFVENWMYEPYES